jgi:hypothetical protein
MNNTSKQKSCRGTNFHCSILIKVEKFTTLLFSHLRESWLIKLSFFLLENHDLICIDVNFFNFWLFHNIIIGCICLLGNENLVHFATLIFCSSYGGFHQCLLFSYRSQRLNRHLELHYIYFVFWHCEHVKSKVPW